MSIKPWFLPSGDSSITTNLFEGAGEEVDERQSEHDPQNPALAQEPAEHHGGVLLDVHQGQVDAMELNKQHWWSQTERSSWFT